MSAENQKMLQNASRHLAEADPVTFASDGRHHFIPRFSEAGPVILN
jgi:hypothetical protein